MSGATSTSADASRNPIPVTPPSPVTKSHSEDRPRLQERSPSSSPSVTPTPTIQNSKANGSNNRSSSAKSEPTGRDIMRPLDTRDWSEIRAKHEALLREHMERVSGLDRKFDTFVSTIKAYLAVLHDQDIQKAKERFEARLNYVQDQEEEYEETREQGSKVLEEFERVFDMMSQFLETAKYAGSE